MDNTDGKKKNEIPLYCMFKGPGPAYRLKTALGTTNHCVTKTQAPAYTIGHKYREQAIEGPGPVCYYDSALTSHGKAHSPAYVLSGKHKQHKQVSATPGPSDYEAHNVRFGTLSDEHKSPSITIGQRAKDLVKSNGPSPNCYFIKTGIGSRGHTETVSPAWSIRGRTEVDGLHYKGYKVEAPGPASYGYTTRKTSSGGYTMQGRNNRKDYSTISDNPGPNAYNPCAPCKPKRGFTMGIKHSEFTMPMISTVNLL